MKAVVILGAGASAGFGVPTLRSLFKDKHARMYLNQNKELRSWLQALVWAPRGLDLERSHLGLTIEDILTLVRDSERQQYGLPEILDAQARDRFRKSLYVLIKRAIYDGKSSNAGTLNALIAALRKHAEHTTWASFNWDCLFEASFWYSSAPPGQLRTNPTLVVPAKNWGMTQSTKHTFLKLHGAINWWFVNGQIVYLPFGASPVLNEKWSAYESGTADGEPVILEPSHYKYAGEMYELLRLQWVSFANAIASADLVIVVGYSLPEADSEARSAVTLGFQANPDARWVVVDPSDGVRAKYEQLLGNRQLVQLPGTLSEWNDSWDTIIENVL
jgi:hypothetical protein